MSDSKNTTGEADLPTELLGEVNQLLAKLCDELLDEQGIARLGELIAAEPAVRNYYLRYIGVHASLAANAGSYADAAEDELVTVPFAEGADACLGDDARGPVRERPRLARWLAAAVILLSFGAAFWLFTGGKQITERSPSATAPEAGRHEGTASPERVLAARITYLSPDLQWQDSNDSHALTSGLWSGDSVSLAAGAIELTYVTGVKLQLTGPSQFTVHGNGGALRRGEIVARVPKQGEGFMIQTPQGKVIDRGTEFGVVVDDFGVSEVNVFEGRVEAFPMGGAGPLAERIDLTKGRMLQWSSDAILSMNTASQALLRRPRLFSNPSDRSPQVSLVDLSVDGYRLDGRQWMKLGKIQSDRKGIRLDGTANAAERPYLITSREFDPSTGPVTISCDVRLELVNAQAIPSFSILTRTDNDRGKPNAPWHDLLASCVRCSLTPDGASSDGMLEVGAKYEHDRELSKISWGGFARPQSGVSYHLEMHDDGLNVSFTATLVDNPSVSKTVTCRSLFRGVHNFIALEGFCGGRTIVSNLQVRTYAAADLTARRPAENRTKAHSRVDGSDLAASEVLKALVPADASLVLAEDFDGNSLNADVWSTLGDVLVEDGALRLGLENAEQHIDTWRPRPYLLTSHKFKPSSKRLTITGRATFAPNFLHGYGGSFAVVTRAEGKYGVGDGWEQSALGRGVRCNFWPAALGQNRSLEIFELLSPEPVNLLAATDFAINPDCRKYLFCITDDGNRAGLTFIDAQSPKNRQRLAHSTASRRLSAGHIAFEGCWGAPVLLDDIRIYESPAPPPAGDVSPR